MARSDGLADRLSQPAQQAITAERHPVGDVLTAEPGRQRGGAQPAGVPPQLRLVTCSDFVESIRHHVGNEVVHSHLTHVQRDMTDDFSKDTLDTGRVPAPRQHVPLAEEAPRRRPPLHAPRLRGRPDRRLGAPAAGAVGWALRVLVVAGLAVDAYVHLHLAGTYQLVHPQGIGQGSLFRIEAAVAIVVAVLVLATGRRLTLLAAAVVGLSALAAVVVYRYVDLPGFGPIPPMYDPAWYFSKSLSAVGELVAGLAALCGLALRAGPGRSTPPSSSPRLAPRVGSRPARPSK